MIPACLGRVGRGSPCPSVPASCALLAYCPQGIAFLPPVFGWGPCGSLPEAEKQAGERLMQYVRGAGGSVAPCPCSPPDCWVMLRLCEQRSAMREEKRRQNSPSRPPRRALRRGEPYLLPPPNLPLHPGYASPPALPFPGPPLCMARCPPGDSLRRAALSTAGDTFVDSIPVCLQGPCGEPGQPGQKGQRGYMVSWGCWGGHPAGGRG